MNMEILAAAQHRTSFWCIVEATHRNHGDDVHRSEVYSGNTLQELFNTCKATEPALGLEYIYECHPNESGNFIYRCTICCCETSLVYMFTHVLGTKHRTAYLRKHHPEKSGGDKKYLKEICSDIERMYGRKSINVIEGTSLPRSFADELSPPPPINYRPDNKLQNMDLENFVDISGKQSAPRCDITFRELKAAHEAKLSKTHTSWAPVQSSSGRQDNVRDLEVLSMECSECDPDEFMCNRELFEFLDSFKIINDTDVSFILKVTESFSNALVRYKKNSAEKKALPNAAGSNAPHSKINQPSIPSAHGFNRYPEPVTNYTPNQLFPSVSQFNPRGPITEPRFPLSVGSASNIPQGQWPNRMPPPYTAVPSPCFVPFPQGMPPPAMPPNVSSGFPPGFPLPKDEANFFASNKEHGGSRSDGYIEQYSCYKPSLQRNSRFKLDKIFD
ncbi:hypothetical protein FKM82_006578 [Ascaphus truei]